MSSKSRRQSSPPPADALGELLPLDAAAEKITAFFSSLGDDSTVAVSVYAVDPKERLRRSFLFTLPSVAELTGPQLMEQVLAKYGAGEYLAEGRDVDGKLVFSPRFTVGPIKGRTEIPDPRPASPPATVPPAGALGELAAVLDRQTKLLEAVLNRPQPSLADQLKEFAALRELFAPAPAAPFDFNKVIEAVTGVLKLRDELGDVAGGGGDTMSVFARALAPALSKIADRALDQSPPRLPAPGPLAASGDASSPPSVSDDAPPPAQGESVPASNLVLKAYVSQIVELAERGVAPADAAQRIADTLSGFPEPMIAAVLDWLDDADVAKNLAAIDARAAQHAQWIEQTVDALLEAATETEEPPAPAAPANGTHAPAQH